MPRCLLLAVQFELRAAIVGKEHFVTLFHCNWNGVTTCQGPSALTDGEYLALVVLQTSGTLHIQPTASRVNAAISIQL